MAKKESKVFKLGRLLWEYDIETAEDLQEALKDLLGSMEIDVPQDRKSTFEPKIVKKRQKDISNIDKKIILMYAKGSPKIRLF